MNDNTFPLSYAIDILYKDINGKSQTLSFNSKEWDMYCYENRYWFKEISNTYPKITYEFNLKGNHKYNPLNIIKRTYINEEHMVSSETIGEMYE